MLHLSIITPGHMKRHVFMYGGEETRGSFADHGGWLEELLMEDSMREYVGEGEYG